MHANPRGGRSGSRTGEALAGIAARGGARPREADGEKVEVLHAGTCVMNHCAYREKLLDMDYNKAGFEVVEGSHPYVPLDVFGGRAARAPGPRGGAGVRSRRRGERPPLPSRQPR